MQEIAKMGDLPSRLAEAFETHMKFNEDTGLQQAKQAAREKKNANIMAVIVLLVVAVLLGALDLAQPDSPNRPGKRSRCSPSLPETCKPLSY